MSLLIQFLPVLNGKEGQMNIPVIISSDFLEAYNVFAPGRIATSFAGNGNRNIPVLISCQVMGREAKLQGTE